MNRRDLIKSSILASSGLMLTRASSTAHSNQQQNNDSKIGIAVLGLGYFASYVAPKIQTSNHSKITALISSDRQKAQRWAKRFGVDEAHIYNYQQVAKVTEDKSVDAVYIVTPVGTHAKFAIQALNAGKHVIVEKTMAASSAEAKQMIAAAKRNNRKLMVAYRARYEPFNQAAIQYAREETYGPVRSIAAHKGFLISPRLGKDNWRLNKQLAGGGALLDIGIYSIQACRYIAGSEPLEVFATTQSISDQFKEVEEHISFMLKFPGGILATGSASWGYDLQNYYQVGAEQASFELNPATSNQNLRLHVTQHNPKTVSEQFLRNIDQIDAEFAHFADCIKHDKQPLTDGTEGLNDLKVIEALYQSAAEQRLIRLS